MAKIGVNVTKAELEHAVEVANEIINNKVQRKLNVTGNATLTHGEDGIDTLNVTGGGGGGGVTVVQTKGQSATAVMSQKAVTDELNSRYTKTETDTAINNAKPTAGDGILINGNVVSAIVNKEKYLSVLPSAGEENTKYYIPNSFPSAIVPYVNLAYEHWGNLSNYPYFIVLNNDLSIRYIFSDKRPYYYKGNGNICTELSSTIKTVRVTKSDNSVSYEEKSYLNHLFNTIDYSNFNVLDDEEALYFSANLDGNIDYSVGLSFTNTFKLYVWKNSQFELIGDCILTGITENIIFPALADYVTSATYNKGMATKQNVVSKVTLVDNSTTALADNTEYSGSNLTTVTFTYPQGDFECYMSLNIASSGTITVTFPTSRYIGSVPTFENDKTYEISIKNGVIVAGEVTSGA